MDTPALDFVSGVVNLTRRTFLQSAGAAALPAKIPSLDPNTLTPFVDPLPVPAVAQPAGRKKGAQFYRVAARQTECKLHRDLSATRLWTYGGSFPGPTFETRSGEPLAIEWANALPTRHFLPIDHTLHGAEASLPEVRSAVHVHGAKVPPASDGYPEDWRVPGKSATYFYPNEQDACALWYHDHTMGINRLNIYAGLLGAFYIRDAEEDALGLPKGAYEAPLILTDRFLRKDGQLEYPESGDPASPWVPEVFGNALLVNGKLFPYLEVEPRKYRFRVLNASNGRFYHLSLSSGQKMHQIGSDQGLLAAPVALESLLIAPGERADVVVDFRGHEGERIVLNNDAFVLIQFRVAKKNAQTDESVLPGELRKIARIPESEARRERVLTLGEQMNMKGESMRMLLNGAHWSMPVTEKPVLGTTEIWNLLNLTEDVHPIHLHLVRFQLLDRRKFDLRRYLATGVLRYAGEPSGPESGESGWKDTVRAYSGMSTRIIARFEGYAGRYVWHCHLLEHEDNEMMRPFDVVAREPA